MDPKEGGHMHANQAHDANDKSRPSNHTEENMPESVSALENPEHALSPEVADVLNARHTAKLELLALQNEVGDASEINKEYGNARRDVYRSAFEPLKLDVENAVNRLNDLSRAHNTRIADSLQRMIDVKLQRFSSCAASAGT
jgi:hypothetical protein